MPPSRCLSDAATLYAGTDPLLFAVWVCAVLAAACWLGSVLTADYSQVDRLWSLVPPLYACHFAARAGFVDARLNVIALLVVLWGARLTFNFARKGGYRRHGEDYRWAELRQRLGPVWFQVLNATFVAPYQNLLLLLIVLPAYIAWQARGMPLNALDGAAAVAFVVLLLGETVADQQQWRFQCAKQSRTAAGEPVRAEFVTSGLFRYSRHPNFFCEQAMWWTIYLFSVAASGVWLNWSIAGAFLLTLLFQGSTRFTEELTLRKYPAYRAYQQTTSRLIPWVPN
jgi:steroid 5-alpha reductase family enzyme